MSGHCRDHPEPLDPRALRGALGHFATGVCVVGAETSDGRRLGLTVNSFSSVSLDPPLILVCVAKSVRSHDALIACGGFAVSVLSREQADASAAFASSRDPDKWAHVGHRRAHGGGLILEPHLAYFDCTTHAALEGGDHTILLGHVRAFGRADGTPLLYFRGAYDTVSSAAT